MPNVIFLHPDLGIGGAERLIVDAAVALKEKGHSVQILTSHHDEQHCFPETREAIPVAVYGDWLPRTLFGYCYALCAYTRMIYLSICLLFCENFKPDVIIVDQISVSIPLLKWKTHNIIFYCHFPDQLLAAPGTVLKSAYRSVLNWLEELTTNQAKKVFVNSKFTAEVFMKTFTSATKQPEVLYPSLQTSVFDGAATEKIPIDLPEDAVVFLSLNRYERKKNINLAVEAFDLLKNKLPAKDWNKCRLIIAGGYDELLPENIEHFGELKTSVDSLNLSDKVAFLKSPSDAAKKSLIKQARCLIYTPSNEHFGIVPVESMYLETPVVAVNSGGPTETILDGGTGYLCPPTADAFAEAMAKLASNENLAQTLGRAGRQRVKARFGFDEFSRLLDKAVKDVIA